MTDQQAVAEFEGDRPAMVLTKVSGSSQRIHRPIHHGETGVLLVEYKVSDIRHPHTTDGLKRVQVLVATDVFEMPDDEGHDLLVRHRSAYLSERGITELPLDDQSDAE